MTAPSSSSSVAALRSRAARWRARRWPPARGWSCATAGTSPSPTPATPREGTVAWADVSHLRKVEVHGRHRADAGIATRSNGAWWCPITRDRTLVIGGRRAVDGIEVTTVLAALTIVGPAGARGLRALLRPGPARRRRCRSAGFAPGRWRAPRLRPARGHGALPDALRLGVGEYMWRSSPTRRRARRRPDRHRRPRSGGRSCVTSSESGACGAGARS